MSSQMDWSSFMSGVLVGIWIWSLFLMIFQIKAASKRDAELLAERLEAAKWKTLAEMRATLHSCDQS